MPSATGRRHGQGRPIGLLVHWLCNADRFETAEQHKAMGVGNYADRKHARDLCASFTGHERFFEYEADLSDCEEGEEPATIP